MNRWCFAVVFILNTIPVAIAENVMLVGTTGDYPPLTQKTSNGYKGLDICIIQHFANKYGYQLKFESTTWPSLARDMENGRFNVAVGGISATKDRMAKFNFSLPIESSAKVAMIRCVESQKFNNFANIDSESITVIENRGGTNQIFALEHLHKATIKLVPGNYTAIAALTATPPQADVMFTDDVEVDYRHSLNGKLCKADLPETFPQSPKVFLFSKDEKGNSLQTEFNKWWQSNSVAVLRQCKM